MTTIEATREKRGAAKPSKRRAERRPWTDPERDHLVQHYAESTTAQIAAALRRDVSHVYSQAYRLGLRKSEAFMLSALSGRIQRTAGLGRPSQFQPGQPAWNRGVPGSTGRHPHTAANHFKPGEKPHSWLPVGSYRVNADGYLQTKLTDTGYPPCDWVAVHRVVWERANGPVPEGHVVGFRDGYRSTVLEQITLDVLECITRQERMRRNSLHRMPKELAQLVQLRGVLTRQINRRMKDEAA